MALLTNKRTGEVRYFKAEPGGLVELKPGEDPREIEFLADWFAAVHPSLSPAAWEIE